MRYCKLFDKTRSKWQDASLMRRWVNREEDTRLMRYPYESTSHNTKLEATFVGLRFITGSAMNLDFPGSGSHRQGFYPQTCMITYTREQAHTHSVMSRCHLHRFVEGFH